MLQVSVVLNIDFVLRQYTVAHAACHDLMMLVFKKNPTLHNSVKTIFANENSSKVDSFFISYWAIVHSQYLPNSNVRIVSIRTNIPDK